MENLNDLLRSTRESKGLSIDDVSNRTKIRVKIIEAIEQGDYKSAGAPAYVKGFVKIYADHLGLDTKSILKQHAHIFEDFNKPFLMVGKEDEQNSPLIQTPNVHLHTRSLVAFAVIAVIVAAAGLGVFAVIKVVKSAGGKKAARRETVQVGSKPRRAANAAAPARAVTEAPAGVSSAAVPEEMPGRRLKTPAQFGLAAIDQSITPEDEELVLTAEITDDVWMRVKSDDQLIFEDTLKAGDKDSWKAQKSFQIKIGNAGGAKFSLNDFPMEAQGAAGQVKTFEIGQEDLRRLRKKK